MALTYSQTSGDQLRDADRPRRLSRWSRSDSLELAVAAAAGFAAVWVPFHLAGWNAPVGFLLGWIALAVTIYGVIEYQLHGLLDAKDRLATIAIAVGCCISLTPLFLIVYFVAVKGIPVVLTHFPHFLTHDLRDFAPQDPVGRAGMKHAIIGTLEQVGLATALTVPLGILAATYLNEIGGRYASVVRTVADAMTGLPTIIAGLFVYVVWVLPRKTNGFSGFAAALALSVIMLPTIVRTAEEVLRIVSDGLREAALALGAPQWRMVMMVVLPTARAGLATAAILGVARAVGETAPVLLTAHGAVRTNLNPFAHAQADLPITVYGLVTSPVKNNVAVAWGGAVLLVAIVLTLFMLARILGTGGPGGRQGAAGRVARTRARVLRSAGTEPVVSVRSRRQKGTKTA